MEALINLPRQTTIRKPLSSLVLNMTGRGGQVQLKVLLGKQITTFGVIIKAKMPTIFIFDKTNV